MARCWMRFGGRHDERKIGKWRGSNMAMFGGMMLINTHFSLEEIEDLCFKMGIDDENLRGQTKMAKARALVIHCHRTATLEALKQHMLDQRPNLRDQLGG